MTRLFLRFSLLWTLLAALVLPPASAALAGAGLGAGGLVICAGGQVVTLPAPGPDGAPGKAAQEMPCPLAQADLPPPGRNVLARAQARRIARAPLAAARGVPPRIATRPPVRAPPA